MQSPLCHEREHGSSNDVVYAGQQARLKKRSRNNAKKHEAGQKKVGIFEDLKQSLQEALAYEQRGRSDYGLLESPSPPKPGALPSSIEYKYNTRAVTRIS
jgi:hypothetical protein